MQEVNKLIEDMIAAIHCDMTVETLEITRDALVEGRTCEHRIDLYWKFKSRDIVYQALIDTSHYNEEKITKKMTEIGAQHNRLSSAEIAVQIQKDKAPVSQALS